MPPAPQSVYQNASNFSIGMQNLTIHNGPSAPRLGRNELPKPIPDASHNRNRKTAPPDSSCLPGTREAVITKIISWAKVDNPDHAQIVLWLCGSVGSGKSAISQAVAEALDRCSRLAASFFFFRGSGDRSRFAKFPITLASQMAVAIPDTAPYIMGAVERMVGWSVSKQMEELVYKPIQLAFADRGSAEFVSVVLDGLDECQDKEEVEEFIDHLLEYFGGNPSLPLRFIIASRIEQHIQARLETEHVEIENLAHHLSDDDIRTFLLVSFSRAAKQSRVIRSYGKWPTDKEVETLLSHIDGSFIFASTIVKYILGISNDGLTPMERLPLALEMNPGLDGLYTETLERCSHFPHFTDILASIVLAQEPLGLSELSGLLQVPMFKVLNVLINLQAIIHIPGKDYSQITIFHTSFRDYLTTESRSGPFFISPGHHDELACKWLKAVCCSSHLDERSGDMRVSVDRMSGNLNIMVISLPWICHALHHWTRGSSVPSTLAFVKAFINHCCPYYSPVENEPIPWTVKYDRFHTVIFRMLHAIGQQNEDTGISRDNIFCEPSTPYYMAQSGNLEVPFIIVRTAILFFNYCMSCSSEVFRGEIGAHFLLRYWVKHLAAAVEGDSSLTLEFLQKRDYQSINHNSMPDPRICEWYTYLSDSQAMNELKDDVLAAQRAIEARFPGTLPSMHPVLRERQQLVIPPYPEQFDAGVSVLDIFNAYHNFVLIDASPLEETSALDEPNHIEVNFTHERRGYIPRELRLHMYRDSPVTKEDPVYIGFSVTFLDAEFYPHLYNANWEEGFDISEREGVCRITLFVA